MGNGIALGLTDGMGNNSSIYWNGNVSSIVPSAPAYGLAIPNETGAASPYPNATSLGITTDSAKSGVIASLSGIALGEVPSEKFGNFYIHY